MNIYELSVEDLTSLGHMGSSSTLVETRLYDSLEKAQAYAEADYGKEIKWSNYTKNSWTSGDLMFVEYIIRIKTVE